jgi:phage/plasmid primase-like uncharacterized protein
VNDDLRSALLWLDPNCDRETWFKALAGFKAGGGDVETADDWSRGGDSYTRAAFRSTWKSLRPDGGITERTLYRMARDAGWKPENPANLQSFPRPKPRREAPPEKRDTAPYARRLWAAGDDSDKAIQTHPYALRKRVQHALGARRGTASGSVVGADADCLLIPMRDWDGHLTGVECINPEGKKQTFGSKGLLVLGMPEDRLATVHICEGWATAWALAMMFPLPFACVVTFGKGRLEKTAREAAERFPGDVLMHVEKHNRDAWDVWNDGLGKAYAARGMGRAA